MYLEHVTVIIALMMTIIGIWRCIGIYALLIYMDWNNEEKKMVIKELLINAIVVLAGTTILTMHIITKN